ncbi:MAG: phage Gp37/Gp68 family protein [Oscillospiraceae bacterium]|nr:phage Gp37/Gp68 family protein [Oscillospiraceae bacterium]
MNITKIEWSDRTYNPVTGCRYNCGYCYAVDICKRFGGYSHEASLSVYGEEVYFLHKSVNGCHELDVLLYKYTKKGKVVKAPYPFGFEPTLHRYRLDKPSQIAKPQNIFVCSMADLFGEWVPDEWIEEVFKSCAAAPQHRYLFLTKNPKRYHDLKLKGFLPKGDNYWFGFSAVTYKDLITKQNQCSWLDYHTFISFEPLQSNIELPRNNYIRWAIIGAESGTSKVKVIPERRWIENIVRQCREKNVPVFMKDNLIPIIGEENMLREFPWEV